MIKKILKLIINLAIISVVVTALVFVLTKMGTFPKKEVEETVNILQKNAKDNPFVADNARVDNSKPKENEEIYLPTKESVPQIDMLLQVPFVLQAPFANWSDPLFQDACEEAAILMADGWLQAKKIITKEDMDKEIRKIAEMEIKSLGTYIDSSVNDTARILKDYTKHANVKVLSDIKLEDIKNEITQENLVIVPTNGQKLGNPFYKAPGPVTHMIVIIGYDSAEKEFITNDSGTRKGEKYRYKEDVLFKAIRDYPTGNHYENPIDENVIMKNGIIVENN